MEYLNRAVNFASEYVFRKRRPQEGVLELSRVDAYLNLVFRVITWEDPRLTWCALILLNLIFALIVYYEVRFYCFLFTAILGWVLLDFHGEIFDFKQQAKVVSYRSINDSVRGLMVYLQSLKRENPSMFCGIMMTVFLSMSFIGRTVSGRLLSYIVLLCLFFGPYLVSLTPKEYRKKVRHFLRTFRNHDGIVAETELIPFIANKNFNEERDPDLDSLLTDRTQDSITNSLVSGLSTMPSHLEPDATNLEELEEDDLLPHTPSSRALSCSAIDYSSDSDSDHRNMEFDSAHFNKGSSSSEEENEYAKGLRFVDAVDAQRTVQQLGTGLLSLGSNLLSNVLQTVAAGRPAVRQDSDSDFEMINSEDAEDS